MTFHVDWREGIWRAECICVTEYQVRLGRLPNLPTCRGFRALGQGTVFGADGTLKLNLRSLTSCCLSELGV